MSDDHDQLDPAEALMREVGAQLRQVRLERGQDLDEVGEHLRIKSAYLLGIEEGDLSMMPGRTYALGFLRSYADYLGFDGEDLIVQIKSTVANLTDKTRLRMRTPLPESRLPKTPILVLSLAAVAGIYAGWSYLHRGSQLAIETVAQVPAGLRHLAGGGGDGVAPPAADVARTPPLAAPVGIEPPAQEAPSAVTPATPTPAINPSMSSATPGGPAGTPQTATAGPHPDGMAEAPAAVAPAPPPSAPAAAAPPLPAPATTAQTPPPATAPAAKTQPGVPLPPAVAPEGGPGLPSAVAAADAPARPDTSKPTTTATPYHWIRR
jgi:cytoskeletal protein RodZ